MVGYEMKRRRFVELHREAVRWPMGRFEYIGIDAEAEGSDARQGEVSSPGLFPRRLLTPSP